MNTWPSTTEVLRAAGLYGNIAQWSEKAADERDPRDKCTSPLQRGRVTDFACNTLLHGMKILPEWFGDHETCCVPFVDGYVAFLKRHHVKHLQCGSCEGGTRDFEVVNQAERYKGHPDQLVMLDGVRVLLDIKTGGMPPTTPLQTASYDSAMLSMGMPRVTRFGLQLARGDFKLHPFTDPRDRDEWTILVRAHHIKAKYGVAA